jgi:hemolysin activation/secretion protein
VNGVRAYPSGEAYGDEGVLVHLEVRYAINSFTPYAFFEAGTLDINHDASSVGDNKRSLAGAGRGFRFNM